MMAANDTELDDLDLAARALARVLRRRGTTSVREVYDIMAKSGISAVGVELIVFRGEERGLIERVDAGLRAAPETAPASRRVSWADLSTDDDTRAAQ